MKTGSRFARIVEKVRETNYTFAVRLASLPWKHSFSPPHADLQDLRRPKSYHDLLSS